ncbi:MAG: hypothetical protein KDK39_07715 [Leptospiraceae bacterium]|nr:hypothetical protein [Leptospiraceae bacterium]
MSHRIAKNWLRDAGRGCLVQVLAGLIVIPILGLFLFYPLYLANQSHDPRAFLWVGISAAIGIGLLIGSALAIGLFIRRRQVRLIDAAMEPLGLSGQNYLRGRQYHGNWSGRSLDIYYSRGPSLEIYVSAPTATRVSFRNASRTGSRIASWMGQEQISTGDQLLDSALLIHAADAEWTRQLVAQPGIATFLMDSLQPIDGYELRNLQIQPDALRLHWRRFTLQRLQPATMPVLLEGLLRLATAIARLPAPGQQLQSTASELWLQRDRSRLHRIQTRILAGLSALLILLVIAILLLIHLAFQAS